MNRIQHRLGPSGEVSDSSTFSLESDLFDPPVQDSSRALFVPLHYEPNYAYPLLVWLHAPGSDHRQLTKIMPRVSTRNFIAVAPKGFRTNTERSDREDLGWPQTQEHVEAAARRVFESIKTAQRRFRVCSSRVFLAGFDSGGTMAFRVAMNYPNRFAGVLSICGRFPRGHNPFGRLAEARKLPVLLTVGRDSRRYPPAVACDDLRLFHSAGISVDLRQYPCGHELDPRMLRDVNHWIIEQITDSANSPAKPDSSWSYPSD